jgi:hypothetical protein
VSQIGLDIGHRAKIGEVVVERGHRALYESRPSTLKWGNASAYKIDKLYDDRLFDRAHGSHPSDSGAKAEIK